MKISLVKKIHCDLLSKKRSAREITDGYLSAVKQKDEALGAFLSVFEKHAQESADAVDAKMARGEELGLFEGVPVAVKDSILIEGEKATAASKILENYTAAYDAFVIEKLRRAGAIFIGKTNLDEFALGSSTENSAIKKTVNPHDIERVPGGSSGGSAVAVAADLAPVALGSDTGGSIRQPAAFCGVVGFKPSYGAVSRSGLIAMASSLDQIGPLATSVEDAELLFEVIRGADAKDATSQDIEKGVRKDKFVIGVPEEFFGGGLSKEVGDVVRNVIARAGESESFSIEPISLPCAEYALACYYIIMPAEVSSNLARFDGMRYGKREEAESMFGVYKNTRGKGFGAEAKRRIAIGTYVLSHGYYDAFYVKANKVRKLIERDFDAAFKKVDVIATPATPTVPFKIGEKVNDPLSMYLEDIYTVPANLAGIPAISLPAGQAGDLPVGIQLFGGRFRDFELLDAAKKLEYVIS